MRFLPRLTRARRALGLGALVLALAAPRPCPAQDAAPAASPYPHDPGLTRLFFGPTGRSLPAGGGYAGAYGFALPFVQVGMSDRISIGGGTPLFVPFSVVWVTPKAQIVRTSRVQAAAGVVHLFTGDAVERHLGVAYGVATFGSEDRAVTAGAGWGYARGWKTHGDGAIVMLGAERRISRRTKLITENYFTGGAPVVMAGVRQIGERFSADAAMVVVASPQGPLAFPLLNVVCRLGRH